MIVKKYWYIGCLCMSLVYAKAVPIGKPPIIKDPVSPTCGSWQEQSTNDVIAMDCHCMQAYLKQYTTKARQYSRVGSQRFSLPIIGGFPAQHLMV